MRLYVHIPYCNSKCYYCSFYSLPGVRSTAGFLQALKNELYYRVGGLSLDTTSADTSDVAGASGSEFSDINTDGVFESIYIGGGTPNALNAKDFEQLLSIFDGRLKPGGEYTVELNPEALDARKAEILRAHGVNRCSLGVQSTNDKVLRAIGRRHDFKDAEKAARLLISEGIDNLTFDYICGIGGEDAEDADRFADFADTYAKHVSVYSLEYEGSRFPIMSEDEERSLFEHMLKALRNRGFERYEISNFCKAGYRAEHNSAYWALEPYIGLGPGASSYDGSTRTDNLPNLDKYIDFYGSLSCEKHGDKERQDVKEKHGDNERHGVKLSNENIDKLVKKELLTLEDHMVEALILPLRTTDGIDIEEYKNKFGIDLKTSRVFRQILENGLAMLADGRLFLTDRGFDIYSYICSDFMAELFD